MSLKQELLGQYIKTLISETKYVGEAKRDYLAGFEDAEKQNIAYSLLRELAFAADEYEHKSAKSRALKFMESYK